ncbi:MAG: response regulator [Caulobacteraceae bacterium]
MPKQIVRHAPYLRRYARALTGAQARGDVLVQAAMEALLTGAVKLDGALPLRSGLYKVLHEMWVRSPDHDHVGGAGNGDEAFAPDQRLQVLSPDERAALLLTSMEGFTPMEAAQVLGASYEEIEARLLAADTALQAQLATDVLIIEDEPIIGLDLMRLARELGHRVTGVAATRDEAVAMAKQFKPGLVLADIRLADGSSGMDAAADILKSFEIPVIFITAFPEHLLTGERPEPAFLITKPFREETVKALIGQALFFHRPSRDLALSQEPAVSL